MKPNGSRPCARPCRRRAFPNRMTLGTQASRRFAPWRLRGVARRAVANDAGVSHMLGAADIPLLTLYGPTDFSEKFRPRVTHGRVLRASDYGSMKPAPSRSTRWCANCKTCLKGGHDGPRRLRECLWRAAGRTRRRDSRASRNSRPSSPAPARSTRRRRTRWTASSFWGRPAPSSGVTPSRSRCAR